MQEQLTQAWAAFLSGRRTSVALRALSSHAEPGRIPEGLQSRLERSPRLRSRMSRTPRSDGPKRWAEWIAAREAELTVEEALISQGVSSERILSSVSHSHGHALCVGADGTGLVALGVDLESEDRLVRPEVASRVVQPQELAHGLGFLDYWVIKEAAFKACPESSLVPAIVLQAWDSKRREGRVASPSLLSQGLSCRVAWVAVGGVKVGFAVSSNVRSPS